MPRPSASLHLGGSSVAESAPAHTQAESAKFYLVPNGSGTGKTIVRRRVPPPPISPTLEGILSFQPGGSAKTTEMDSVNNKRPTLAIRTTSPLAELNDGSTARTLTPKPRFDPMRSFRNSFRSRQDENDDPSMSRRQWKGKEKAIVVDEAEESRESKVAAKAREIRAWMMGKSGSDIHRSTAYPDHRQDKGETSYATKTRQTVGGFFKNHRRDTSRLDRGPKPGQTYEIVNRRIVENSPEKTVEISTWREHAVEQANDEEDKMSIYYINADEYTREGFYANEANPKVEWRMEGSVVSQADRLGSNTGSTSPPYLNPGNQADMNIPQVEKQQQRSKSPYKQATTPRAGTISPSTSEKDPEPEQNASTNSRVKVSSRRESGSRQSTSRRRGRYKESTPIEKDLPKSSFHPTRSGSTISSIKSGATLELEAILMSCEPSLLHVSPILKSLGIRRIEHLKAVARLTPGTRDRELKEDALRLGITVMEWAILLDKIFTLQ